MAYQGRDRQPQNATPLVSIDPGKWADLPVPERRWLVQNVLVRGSVTLLSGDGGVGKSLLMQQLMTAIALGGDYWVGIEMPPDPIVSLGIFCEDDEEELWRRQADINRTYNIGMGTISGTVNLISRVTDDNILAYFSRDDKPAPTVFYDQITHKIRETGAQLIVVDTAADAFGGNENYRNQMRSFINLLRKWSMAMDGGVILTAHPSNFGLMSGSGTSGSTGWHNTVRARCYLTKPKDDIEEYGEQENTNERILTIMKSNYGPDGNQIRLRWEHGIFAPVNARGSGIVDKIDLNNTFLREVGNLMAHGVRVLAAERGSPRNFIGLLSGRAALKRWNGGELRAAKERLLENGRLVRVRLGPPSRAETLIRPADLRYPGEEDAPSI